MQLAGFCFALFSLVFFLYKSMASTLFHASHLSLLCNGTDATSSPEGSTGLWYAVHDIQYIGLTDSKCTCYLKISEELIKLGTPTLKVQTKRESQSISYLFC